ncbi:hypothetical protein [Tenacibaculum finnmarkense]|uniref:hypothetical protein n=1 Tax=Tenacibaculum finnmarkense TaxID=2781243 RepID=UPI00187B6F61|nr:hypothetical protein [Tenacibaculum finnmarkense]MBE7659402.1 hypothetical protein [Tenacibaculum finnmarkense genomovar finnmarkense]MCD8453657.1 hypothetical protein [Tenacibaculum finnmarkense genomovar ulcerans]MCG8206537.1 hypothetical protein [Tenacibaculum finnmarkense genomovar finnmarkense]MCG8251035.1 hypothetical protein [Tenacibaculum finnmarkense genomovar finnmarkense]MCG8722581.1 hypothetical protein [Tenacibaculum finnmarkense]
MPANTKYLTTSAWQKAIKIISGILGGYIISALLHLALTLFLPYQKELLITSIYTLFIIWVTLIIVPFLFKNAWKVFLLYSLVILVLFSIVYYGKIHYPLV